MKVSQILANRRKIEQSIRSYGSIFRKLFRQVILDQEARVLQRIPAIAKPTLKNVMDREYENKVLALAMRPVYITIMTDSANEVLKDFPKPKEPEFKKAMDPRTLLDEKIFKYADKYSIAMAKYVNQTTAKEIKKTILDGMKEGLHYNEISKNIGGKVFNNLKEGERAKRLAYTEAHGLVENGSYEGAAASGVVQEKTWSSAADARPTHLAANGQTVLVDDVFIVGAGYKLRFPGDTSLGAGLEEIMRCRCSVGYSSVIHEDRITTSQELLAKQPEIEEVLPKEDFKISQADVAHLEMESDTLDGIFDKASSREQAGETKARIMRELAEELKGNKDFLEYVGNLFPTGEAPSKVSIEYVVNNLIGNWAVSSGDANIRAIAMQMAAHEEFGLANVAMGHYNQELRTRAWEYFNRNGKALKAFVRAQYNATQEFFKASKITSITGYRGMAFTAEDAPADFIFSKYEVAMAKDTLQLQPISSFSTSPITAVDFTYRASNRVVLQSEIPVERILSTCQTGYGCKHEVEFTVLGGKEKFKIATYGGDQLSVWNGDKVMGLFGGMK